MYYPPRHSLFKSNMYVYFVRSSLYVGETLIREIIFGCVETCKGVKFAHDLDMFWDLVVLGTPVEPWERCPHCASREQEGATLMVGTPPEGDDSC